jgi:predicted transcriptional regulator
MTLTVRLHTSLESALDSYCAERGVTKSLVVQESLAAYLLDAASAKAKANSAAAGRGKAAVRVSANYKAFADAGLIGAGELGGVSATNQVVRERAMQSIRRKAP